MSLYNYRLSLELAGRDLPIEALIMAAMAKADDRNGDLLRAAWPERWAELRARHHAPGGLLPTDILASGQLDAGEPRP